jgi:hypothetical protein
MVVHICSPSLSGGRGAKVTSFQGVETILGNTARPSLKQIKLNRTPPKKKPQHTPLNDPIIKQLTQSI